MSLIELEDEGVVDSVGGPDHTAKAEQGEEEQHEEIARVYLE
jgi:hypothetical protein